MLLQQSKDSLLKPSFTIIGTGFIFPRHINAIQAVGGEIVDVINDFGGRKSEWLRVIMTTKARYVVILTPNHFHFDMALIARRFGKTILCEKPLTTESSSAKILSGLGNIYTVLQLRHHPLVEEIKKMWDTHFDVNMDIGVSRDLDYLDGWKGNKELSGGILFNLGIHYFDLLLHLFGPAKVANTTYCDERIATGVIEGENYSCEWRMSTAENKDSQRRVFNVNGKEFNFSSKDNLSQEDLHIQVYRDLLAGKGITASDALPSIELVEKLYAPKS